MKNLINQTQVLENCLGGSRHFCLQALSCEGIDSIDFGHWLAIPSQQLLLVFRHQQCVAVNDYPLLA